MAVLERVATLVRANLNDLIDRAETHAVQRRLGLDANPWRTFPRIIASYYYLRQPDNIHAGAWVAAALASTKKRLHSQKCN